MACVAYTHTLGQKTGKTRQTLEETHRICWGISFPKSFAPLDISLSSSRLHRVRGEEDWTGPCHLCICLLPLNLLLCVSKFGTGGPLGSPSNSSLPTCAFSYVWLWLAIWHALHKHGSHCGLFLTPLPDFAALLPAHAFQAWLPSYLHAFCALPLPGKFSCCCFLPYLCSFPCTCAMCLSTISCELPAYVLLPCTPSPCPPPSLPASSYTTSLLSPPLFIIC